MSMEYDDLDWGAAVRVIAAALQSESNGIPTFPHRPSLLSLRPPSQCFRGNEGVDWMMNNCEVSNREAAIFIGQALLNDGIFTSVMHEVHPEEGLQRFVDSDEHFYTFLVRKQNANLNTLRILIFFYLFSFGLFSDCTFDDGIVYSCAPSFCRCNTA